MRGRLKGVWPRGQDGGSESREPQTACQRLTQRDNQRFFSVGKRELSPDARNSLFKRLSHARNTAALTGHRGGQILVPISLMSLLILQSGNNLPPSQIHGPNHQVFVRSYSIVESTSDACISLEYGK